VSKENRREFKSCGTWKPWRAPADLTPALIGARPGVYVVRAITAPQTPVQFPVRDERRRRDC
jgi:hypothetical protein